MTSEPAIASRTEQKLSALLDQLKQMGSLLIAFSGGVDSTFLLAVAVETLVAEKVLAVTARSETYPAHELDRARQLARQLGARHMIIETCELSNPHFLANPPDRCYYCKLELVGKLKEIAGR